MNFFTKAMMLFLVSYSIQACIAQNKDYLLSAPDFQQAVLADKDAVVLDVRTPTEYSEGYLFNAHNIDYEDEQFENRLSGLDRTKTYYVYCLGGSRSASAIKIMRKEGFANIKELKGGMMAWRKADLPVVEQNAKTDAIAHDEYLKMVESGYVLVDFYAPWCIPCKKLEPILKSLGETYTNKLKIVRINIDENVKLAVKLSADEIPVLKLYNNGKLVWEERGLVSRETITTAIEKFQ